MFHWLSLQAAQADKTVTVIVGPADTLYVHGDWTGQTEFFTDLQASQADKMVTVIVGPADPLPPWWLNWSNWIFHWLSGLPGWQDGDGDSGSSLCIVLTDDTSTTTDQVRQAV